MPLFLVDPDASIPVHAQLKLQIKRLYALQVLKHGDALPSIRALARQLGIGGAAVRRAYHELKDAGLLASHHRKYVAIHPALLPAPEDQRRASACVDEGERFLAWCRAQGINPLAAARALLHQALARELTRPSLVLVDGCPLIARALARRIERAWEVKIEPLSVGDLQARLPEHREEGMAILALRYVAGEIREIVRGPTPRVLELAPQPDPRLVRRIARLRPGTRVVFVFTRPYATGPARALLHHYATVLGGDRRLEARPPLTAAEWQELLRADRRQLVAVASVLWSQLPATIRRHPRVVRFQIELDMPALEGLRLAAGVPF